MTPTPIRRALPRGCLCLLLLLGGCQSIPGVSHVENVLSGRGVGDGRITQQELRDALMQYASRFEATVVAAADQISLGTKDPTLQRFALRWKLGLIPIANEAAFIEEPEAAYVALLTIVTSMHEFLTAGAGATIFGDQQQLAVDASNDLLAAAKQLGARFLSEKEQARIYADVEKLVKQRPVRGDFVAEGIQNLVNATQTSGVFDWVTALPMVPFRALTGVDEGAQAIREFNETAKRFSRIAAGMPLLMRWNLELLALDLGRQPSIASAIESIDAVGRSADALSQAAAALPENLRGLMSDAERSSKTLLPLATSLERTATAVGAAGTAWANLVTALQAEPANAPPAAESHPFDIRDWEKTAAQVTAAATELRALLDSMRTLAAGQEVGGLLDQLTGRVEQVEARSRALVDFAALRALELIVAFFVLLFLYRRLEGWLGRRAARE
jgi:plasmid stabilization system protein ParE